MPPVAEGQSCPAGVPRAYGIHHLCSSRLAFLWGLQCRVEDKSKAGLQEVTGQKRLVVEERVLGS